MIHPFQRANIMAIQDDLPLQLVPVLLDVVVLDHDDDHVHLAQELVEVQDLVLHDLLVGEEGVEGFERTGEVTFLDVEHLERRTLADVIDILLVGKAIEAHAAIVRDAVLLHDLVDPLQHEDRLAVVGFHGLVDDLGQLGIVAHEEPGIDADAVSTHAGAGLEDVHARMHVANLDDLIHVHVVVAADAAEFIGKGDIHGPVCILHHLGHFRGTDVGHDDLALAERGIIPFHLLADGFVVGPDGAVVM